MINLPKHTYILYIRIVFNLFKTVTEIWAALGAVHGADDTEFTSRF